MVAPEIITKNFEKLHRTRVELFNAGEQELAAKEGPERRGDEDPQQHPCKSPGRKRAGQAGPHKRDHYRGADQSGAGRGSQEKSPAGIRPGLHGSGLHQVAHQERDGGGLKTQAASKSPYEGKRCRVMIKSGIVYKNKFEDSFVEAKITKWAREGIYLDDGNFLPWSNIGSIAPLEPLDVVEA